MRIECKNPLAVVKQAFYLAWQACGSPLNMGWMQNNPSATREDVWKNINTGSHGGDYTSLPGERAREPQQLHSDYVFGRMMKLSLSWTDTAIECTDNQPKPDYQGWMRVYPSYEALINAAITELNKGDSQ